MDLSERVAEIYLTGRLAPIPVRSISPAPRPKVQVLAPEKLRKYEGDYKSEELDVIYRVRASGGGLAIELRRGFHRDQLIDKLACTGKDRFQAGWLTILFETGGLRVSTSRALNICFQKLQPSSISTGH